MAEHVYPQVFPCVVGEVAEAQRVEDIPAPNTHKGLKL